MERNAIIPFRDIHPIWENMKQFEEEIDKYFKDPYFTTICNSKRVLPKVNIKEDEKQYIVEVAVPGYNKKDIEIEYKDNNLILTSKKIDKKEENDGNYIHKEISGRSFYRVIPFMAKIDENKIGANYKDGILTISMPKKEVEKEKIIKIKVD